MIDIPDDDIVALRHTSAGRFVLFTSTDLPAACPIPWCGATVDTGGDGHGLLVRLDERSGPEGWTALDLLAVTRGRAEAEDARRGGILAAEVARHLAAAIGVESARCGGAVPRKVAFRPGGVPSPYPWAVASLDAFELPLCPDPESSDEGIPPEALLIVIEQLFADAAQAFPRERRLRDARRHVTAAIATEVARVMAARRSSP